MGPETRNDFWRFPGEIHELKEELRSLDRPKKKDAVKKVIAAMTVGKDVSMLFPDVVNCMQTDDLELKKLVYLYLINYAKTQPDLAIMAVNTFVKVGVHPDVSCPTQPQPWVTQGPQGPQSSPETLHSSTPIKREPFHVKLPAMLAPRQLASSPVFVRHSSTHTGAEG